MNPGLQKPEPICIYLHRIGATRPAIWLHGEAFPIPAYAGIKLINSQIHARNLPGPVERDLLSSSRREKEAVPLLAFSKAVLLVE